MKDSLSREIGDMKKNQMKHFEPKNKILTF